MNTRSLKEYYLHYYIYLNIVSAFASSVCVFINSCLVQCNTVVTATQPHDTKTQHDVCCHSVTRHKEHLKMVKVLGDIGVTKNWNRKCICYRFGDICACPWLGL